MQAKISVCSPCRSPESLQVMVIASYCLIDNLFREALQLSLSISTERWLLRIEWFGEEGETGTLDGGGGAWAPFAECRRPREWVGVAWPDECGSFWSPSFTLEPTRTGGPACGLPPTHPHLLQGLRGLQKVIPEDDRGPGKMDRYPEDFLTLWMEE